MSVTSKTVAPKAKVQNLSTTYYGLHEPEDHFKLDIEFLKQFETMKPNFGFSGMGEFTFYRTYSRVKADGSKESFLETIIRVVEGCYEIQRRYCNRIHLTWDYNKAQKSAQEMFMLIWDFKFLPPGRGLWMMGTPFMWERGGASLNNCGFCSTTDIDKDPAEPFCFLMDMSMLGVGVGFDTKGADKLTIAKPDNSKTITFIVPDSREGWVESLRWLVSSYTDNNGEGVVEYDYSKIRKANSKIKGFGGRASGPGILIELHGHIKKLLESRIGKTLRSTDIVDMMNLIGKCIVAGNVRRCLPKGTLVHLKRGLVPIEDVKVGDLALTADGYHTVTENVYQGVQKVLTIKNKMGEFKCTNKHRIAVMTAVGEYEWKRAYQLKQGDRMVFVDEVIPGTNTKLPEYSSTSREKLNLPEFTSDVAWFLGYIHGDGYVYPGRINKNRKHHGASVSAPVNQDEYHDDIMYKVKLGFSLFGFNNPKNQPSKDNCVKIKVTSRFLSDYFYKHFKQAKKPINVPECVLLGSPEIRSAYLAGLLDSDGSTKCRPATLLVSVYGHFIRQVQAVYSSLGIPTKAKLKTKASSNSKSKWSLSLVGDLAIDKFNELIKPYAVKQLRQTKHASGFDFGFPSEWVDREIVDYGRSWSKSQSQSQMTYNRALQCGAIVKSLVPIEVLEVVNEEIECETYDLSVPSRSEFVAQGQLVHNTAEIAFGDHDDARYVQMKNAVATIPPEYHTEFYNITYGIYARPAGQHTAAIEDFASLIDKGVDKASLQEAVDTWNANNNHRWASNNSIFAEVGMNYDSVAKSIAVNGEPGLFWLDNARDYGRMIDGYKPGIDGMVMGGNPCFSGNMRLLTVDGYKTMQELWIEGGYKEYNADLSISLENKYGMQQIVNHKGPVQATNVYKTGESELFRVKLSDGSHIDATSNHQFIILRSENENLVEARLSLADLKLDDKIPSVHGFLGATSEISSLNPDDILQDLIEDGIIKEGSEIIKDYKEWNKYKYSTVASIESVGVHETFCLTEPGSNTVVVEGHYVGQCLEQSLESYELCCLVETFPSNHDSVEEYMRTLKFAYLYAKTVTLLPTHNQRTNSVMMNNRRIGLSQSGIVDAFEKFGRRNVLIDFCDRGYKEIEKWDAIYSKWLCCTKSIKKTSVKPSGTVSLLAGVKPGIHYPEARHYWRRIRVSAVSPLVQAMIDAGYHVEQDLRDPHTMVVKFAVSDPNVRPTEEVTIWEQVANAVDYQTYWADNQVSVTVKFQQHEANQIAKVLEVYEDKLKGISFLPHTGHNYQQAPYEPCTSEEVTEYNSKIRPIDFGSFINEDAIGSKFCDGDKCEI